MLKSIISIIVVFVALNVSAQEVLTLELCRQKALEHNQNVKTAEADYAISLASSKLSKRAMLPQFDLSATYTYMNDPQVMDIPGFELPTLAGQPSGVFYPGGTTNLTYHNNYSGGIDFSLPIYMGGKLRNYIKMSDYGINISEKNLNNTKDDLVLEVDQQYWSLVSLKENYLVLEKSVKLLEDVVRETKNRARVGIVTKNEVLKTQVELNNAKLALIQLTNAIQLSKMALNQTIGNTILTDVVIEDSLIVLNSAPVNVADIEARAIDRNELQILENQVEITNANRKVTRSDYLPQLVSFANYGFQNPNHKAMDETELTWNAGVSLSIPVFHWGEKHLKVKQAKLATEKAQLTYDKAKEGIMLEIQQSIYKVNESLVQISFTKESLNQADENLKLEMNRLKQGIVTTTDVLDAQVQWQKANSDFIAAKANYKINESNYYKTIGSLQY